MDSIISAASVIAAGLAIGLAVVGAGQGQGFQHPVSRRSFGRHGVPRPLFCQWPDHACRGRPYDYCAAPDHHPCTNRRNDGFDPSGLG